MDVLGSSPLTRGKRARGECLLVVTGLIPAHAGKTDPHRAYRPHDGAHPRSRGENATNLAKAAQVAGSSPLTRGKLRDAPFRRVFTGLIPAHAGKTDSLDGDERRPWAHPRSRGENVSAISGLVTGTGSSPLTRGKQAHIHVQCPREGLIPAHAGKTLPRAYRSP